MSNRFAVTLVATLASAAFVGISGLVQAGDAADYRSGDCKVVERPASAKNRTGNLSTSVTAGNGQVSAHSSGGQGVTVHSGNGSTSSSVSTTGSGLGSTTVTTSDGNCIIYVDPESKKNDEKKDD